MISFTTAVSARKSGTGGSGSVGRQAPATSTGRSGRTLSPAAAPDSGRQKCIGRSGGPEQYGVTGSPRVVPWGEAAPRPGVFAGPNPTGHPSQAADEGLRMTAQMIWRSSCHARGAVIGPDRRRSRRHTAWRPGGVTPRPMPSRPTRARRSRWPRRRRDRRTDTAPRAVPVRLLRADALLVQERRASSCPHRPAAVQPDPACLGRRTDAVTWSSSTPGAFVYHVGIYAGERHGSGTRPRRARGEAGQDLDEQVWYGRVG